MTLNINTNKKCKGIVACIFAMALSLFAGSCSENDIVEPDNTVKSQLRFEVGGSANTRVSYEGLHSTFDEGDIIGSVIADISSGTPQFKTVATWKYQKGILMLQSDKVNNWDSEGQWLITDLDGNLTLKNNTIKYAFYFFYPVGTSLPSSNESSYDGSYWKKYSASIETTQSTKVNLNKSDFLWIKYDNGISASDQPQKTVSLVFKKKFATIEVDAETELQNIYFIKDTIGTIITKGANLTTGEQTDLTYNVWDPNKPVYMEAITPYKFDTDGKQYRLSIPPQEINGLHLAFTFSPYGESQNVDINLSEKLQKVEEGKIYYIKINKTGAPSIIIKDWEYGKYSILEEED